MKRLSKRAQPVADLKKQEINKLIDDSVNKATQLLSQTNLSNDQKIQQLTQMFNQITPQIEDKIDEATGKTTITVDPNRQQAADDGDDPDILAGGIGDDVLYSDLNEKQLEMGVEVELEHTDNKDLAKEIAKDHLAEQLKGGKDKDEQDYYTKLKDIDPHHDADDGNVPAFWRNNLDYGTRNE
jgi:hypothetical protein